MSKHKFKSLIITLEGKGGVGKSMISQIAVETARGPDGLAQVRVIDSDVNNSSMAQIYPDAAFAAIRDANDAAEAVGTLLLAMRDIASGVVDSAIWDTAAGTEDIIRAKVLDQIVLRARKENVNIVVLRPITTSVLVQQSAIDFAAAARERGIAVVFVRNSGQGRADKYFADWHSHAERLALMPPAVEVVLPDLGCWVADEASALRLSLADIAQGRFDHLGPQARTFAETKFTPGIQLFVADWLQMRCQEFGDAIAQAIANITHAKTKAQSK